MCTARATQRCPASSRPTPLWADFDANTLGGNITNIKGSDDALLYPQASVTLGSTAIDPATGRTMARGATTGGGTWKAEFHGDASAGAPDTVAGTFEAHVLNGHLGGAFAAHAE